MSRCALMLGMSLLVLSQVFAEGPIRPEPPAPAHVPKPIPEVAPEPNTVQRLTIVHRLKWTGADKVARDLNDWLKEQGVKTPEQDGFVVKSDVVIVPELTSNSLLVAASEELQKKIREFVTTADREPKKFKIEIVVKEIQDDGTEVVVTRSNIQTLSNTPSSIRAEDQEWCVKITALAVDKRELNIVRRTYHVGDLIDGYEDRWNGGDAELQKAWGEAHWKKVTQLMQSIETNIAPMTWERAGGYASIEHSASSFSITQSREIHGEIAQLLHKLRATHFRETEIEQAANKEIRAGDNPSPKTARQPAPSTTRR